jgi:hypothetical protein
MSDRPDPEPNDPLPDWLVIRAEAERADRERCENEKGVSETWVRLGEIVSRLNLAVDKSCFGPK